MTWCRWCVTDGSRELQIVHSGRSPGSRLPNHESWGTSSKTPTRPQNTTTGGCSVTAVEVEQNPSLGPPRRSFSLVRTQRTLQIILGLFWLLDAGLQFQPFMFRSSFTTTYLLNNAQNQPDVIRWIITNVGNFVGPHVAVWNTFFALFRWRSVPGCSSGAPYARLLRCRSSGPSVSGSSGRASD